MAHQPLLRQTHDPESGCIDLSFQQLIIRDPEKVSQLAEMHCVLWSAVC